MDRPLLEDEVFVRAYCAAMAAIAASPKAYFGIENTWQEDRETIRSLATDLATDAVAAWRNRPTKPAHKPMCKKRERLQGQCILYEGHDGACTWIP